MSYKAKYLKAKERYQSLLEEIEYSREFISNSSTEIRQLKAEISMLLKTISEEDATLDFESSSEDVDSELDTAELDLQTNIYPEGQPNEENFEDNEIRKNGTPKEESYQRTNMVDKVSNEAPYETNEINRRRYEQAHYNRGPSPRGNPRLVSPNHAHLNESNYHSNSRDYHQQQRHELEMEFYYPNEEVQNPPNHDGGNGWSAPSQPVIQETSYTHRNRITPQPNLPPSASMDSSYYNYEHSGRYPSNERHIQSRHHQGNKYPTNPSLRESTYDENLRSSDYYSGRGHSKDHLSEQY